MSVRIKLRRDTSANWKTVNPVPVEGEPCFETDTGKLKIGDGINPYNSLAYFAGGGGGDVTAAGDNTFTGANTFEGRHITTTFEGMIECENRIEAHSLRLTDSESSKYILVAEVTSPGASIQMTNGGGQWAAFGIVGDVTYIQPAYGSENLHINNYPDGSSETGVATNVIISGKALDINAPTNLNKLVRFAASDDTKMCLMGEKSFINTQKDVDETSPKNILAAYYNNDYTRKVYIGDSKDTILSLNAVSLVKDGKLKVLTEEDVDNQTIQVVDGKLHANLDELGNEVNTLSSTVTSLQDSKQDKLTAGDNITITDDGTISAVSSASANATLLGNETDLNTIVSEGKYYASGSNGCLNRPDGVDAFGLVVLRVASGWYNQICFPSNQATNKIFIRTTSSATTPVWTGWIEVTGTAQTPTNMVTTDTAQDITGVKNFKSGIVADGYVNSTGLSDLAYTDTNRNPHVGNVNRTLTIHTNPTLNSRILIDDGTNTYYGLHTGNLTAEGAKATTDSVGLVKPDGTSITVADDGTISAVSSGSSFDNGWVSKTMVLTSARDKGTYTAELNDYLGESGEDSDSTVQYEVLVTYGYYNSSGTYARLYIGSSNLISSPIGKDNEGTGMFCAHAGANSRETCGAVLVPVSARTPTINITIAGGNFVSDPAEIPPTAIAYRRVK